MRRFRVSRGPSSSEIIRQGQIKKLLCRYGAYSRQLVSKSSASSSSSTIAISKSSTAQQLQSSSMQLATSSRRALVGQGLHEAAADAGVKAVMKPSQLVPLGYAGQMDRGLALAAAQHVARVLADGDINTVEAQQVKEELLHQLERDYGFSSPDQLGLGRIRITIKRRDNNLEKMRRLAELEKIEMEKKRLEEKIAQSRKVQSTAIASSQEFSSSSTKVVKTRVVKKTVKRTVQTVRVA